MPNPQKTQNYALKFYTEILDCCDLNLILLNVLFYLPLFQSYSSKSKNWSISPDVMQEKIKTPLAKKKRGIAVFTIFPWSFLAYLCKTKLCYFSLPLLGHFAPFK